MWRVVFDQSNTVLIPKSKASSADAAKMEARLSIWVLTGSWLPVERVELVAE